MKEAKRWVSDNISQVLYEWLQENCISFYNVSIPFRTSGLIGTVSEAKNNESLSIAS